MINENVIKVQKTLKNYWQINITYGLREYISISIEAMERLREDLYTKKRLKTELTILTPTKAKIDQKKMLLAIKLNLIHVFDAFWLHRVSKNWGAQNLALIFDSFGVYSSYTNKIKLLASKEFNEIFTKSNLVNLLLQLYNSTT